MTNLINIIAWIISFVLTIYASYFAFISLFSLLPHKKKKAYPPKNRFSVIIAARNEETVIGSLIDSLEKQDYPKELYDITVIINNCTDNTKRVSLDMGARVFECKRKIKSKGDALSEYFDYVLKNNEYDAFCIFDADNVVDKNFLSEMNSALCRGARVAQGFRDSKNPYDTWISSCSTIYFYIINNFLNRSRNAIKLSAMVNGSGFVVSSDVIEKMGGWHTQSVTEDIEFTSKCLLYGGKVEWVKDAVYYDEQPLTFIQSWKQRQRWSTGVIQCLNLYFLKLVKTSIKQRSFMSFDISLTLLVPVIQILYIASIIITPILFLVNKDFYFFPRTDIYLIVFLSMYVSYFINFFLALSVTLIERKNVVKMLKGISAFWLFMFSWLIINLLCVFKNQTEWHQIKHTRVLNIEELHYQKK